MSANGIFRSLLRSSFKRKHAISYQSWEDEETALERCDVEYGSPVSPKPDIGLPRNDSPVETLVECFYLGSYDMSGLAIRGRGCIDTPAGTIWKQSQEEDTKQKRKTSLSSKQQHDTSNILASVSKPKYVRLVAGSEDLEVYDDFTGEVISRFSFSQISFVGTHPKHSRLFAFVAVARGSQTPLCHAFKCESKDSAMNTARSLSDVFQHKVQAILAKRQLDLTAGATLLDSTKPINTVSYQSSEEDEELPVECEIDYGSPVSPKVHSIELGLSRNGSPVETLVECFYLGSYDMSGLAIRGRGCIDTPAGTIWKQSQEEDTKQKRKTSLSSKQQHDSSNILASVSKPKYVRLVAGSEDLEVYDDFTGEVISRFSFSQISFVGTHPKHSRLFAFVAVARGSQTPLCHAFKCESKDSAMNTARSLSDVFQHKVQAILAKRQTIRVDMTASATLL